jgi:hypothetical protein
MHGSRRLLIAFVASAPAACNSFVLRAPGGAREAESTARSAMRARRQGALVTTTTPSSSVASLTGTVVASPGLDSGSTYVAVILANATPGDVLPWRMHRGRCDADEGVLGPAAAFAVLRVDDEGRASGSATIPLVIRPDTPGATYHVRVGATALPPVAVSCANLVSPPVTHARPPR